jgi:hypothetical protein
LILEAALSDNEVDDGALGSSLGLVMWVDELGLEVELEGWAHLDIFGSKLDSEGLALPDELPGEERIEGGVEVLTDGLDHEDIAVGDGHLDLLEPGSLAELDGDHLAALTALDPLLSLELWIDDEWVPVAGHHDGGVLKGDSIGWEAFCLPDSLVCVVGKNCEWVDASCAWKLPLSDIWEPGLTPELSSEIGREWSNVGDEGGGDKGVTDHSHSLLLVLDDIVGPSGVLIGETVDESVGQVELVLQGLSFFLDSSLGILGLL